jgi:hypothetical protein
MQSKHPSQPTHPFAVLADVIPDYPDDSAVSAWRLRLSFYSRLAGYEDVKVVAHAKCVTFRRAEVAVPRQLFPRILDRTGQLRLACASGVFVRPSA